MNYETTLCHHNNHHGCGYLIDTRIDAGWCIHCGLVNLNNFRKIRSLKLLIKWAINNPVEARNVAVWNEAKKYKI